MMLYKTLALTVLLLTLPFSVSAGPTMLTTIKPIGLIAKDIAGEHANVDVLLPDSASPHDYALKPSDLKKLRSADSVVWVGPELELFLSGLLKDVPNALQLTSFNGMPIRQYDGQNHDHHQDDHGHDHDGIDAHIWLGPEQAKVVAQAIFENLVAIDPENRDAYAANLLAFKTSVDATASDIKRSLAAQQDKGYFLFHDGYGYFESFFGLTPTGYITLDPERKPGAKTLVTIRSAIREGKASCVFSEPQFNPAMVESLVKGTNTNVELLDPMAKSLTVGKDGYIDFLKQLGSSYHACFNE